jgi:Fe(3+) dicitrate transport protein
MSCKYIVAVSAALAGCLAAQTIEVRATQIAGSAEELARLPGSLERVTKEALAESRVFTIDEALRKVSGVHTRGEEGFGLRPNIGIRGLSPTRSTRVLLLEDGLPLSYAPYGDNASYYHPPVDRFESIEVSKGASQIVYGPMTVGGVINYLTPPVPDKSEGSVMLVGGSRDYLNGHLRYGNKIGRTSFLFDAMRKQGEGARENTRHGLTDLNAKTLTALNARHTFGIRYNRYGEDSNVTYSGLREDEFLANPRGNPFRNDFFNIDRHGAAISHTWSPGAAALLRTNAYANIFMRDWWRQSSNSAQRPNDAADAACGGMANLHTTCGNEGRLRAYYTWGVEPRLRLQHRRFGITSETDFGVRHHSELQIRLQKNGPLPTSRDGVLVEDNDRRARASSAFLHNRFIHGNWSLTPGVRFENVRYRRTNFLLNGGRGIGGNTSVTQWIPGAGVAYSLKNRVTLFTALHRGFAPPRVEDAISNTTGASIDLNPELSWNYEAGARGMIHRDLSVDAALFRLDFSNQIIPSSVAGGVGATLTNAGKTLQQGAEASGRWTLRHGLPSGHSLTIRTAYTYLAVARFAGERFSNIAGFTRTRTTGNRLPYAPRHLLTASASYYHRNGFHTMVESVYTGSQFGDDLNTVGGTPDGQRGKIPGNALWNASFNYPVEAWRATLFLTVKNLTDRIAIIDRTRGILPSSPRLLQLGFRWNF